ncbi:MAG: N-acetylmuramoyl-L-alanine amidase, partial [Rhodospirillaceae bacterium]
DFTRVVLDLNQMVKFRSFSLINPYRIVIDLPSMRWPKINKTVKKGRRVLGYRFGQLTPQSSRLVIDFSVPTVIGRSFVLKAVSGKPHRIVIEAKHFQRQSDLDTETNGDLAQVGKATTRNTRRNARNILSSPGVNTAISSTRPLIVIDPGHGGTDPGARGISGLQEKQVVLKQALILKKFLIGTGRYRVSLTREKDIFLRLRERVKKAQNQKADLFLSIHADSIKLDKIRGASIYTLSEKASDKEALVLAERENKADIIAGMDLDETEDSVARVLIDLRQRLTKNDSVRFAEMLVEEFKGKIRLLSNHRRFAGFAVLKAPEVPSVLVEMGYLSNRKDEMLLKTDNYHRLFASAMVQAIDNYFKRRKELLRP